MYIFLPSACIHLRLARIHDYISHPSPSPSPRNRANGGSYVAAYLLSRFSAYAHAGTIIGLSALVILAGGVLLQFFTILSGAVNSSPINQFYFLEASTSNIPGARDPSRWTFFAICGVDESGHNSNCGNVVPALPFDPPRNFGTDVNVPEQFRG
jgi:hypothetical protein